MPEKECDENCCQVEQDEFGAHCECGFERFNYFMLPEPEVITVEFDSV